MSNSIPSDFPRANLYALAGVQPKISVVETAGHYVAGSESIEQLEAQYLMCEDLAHQMRDYCTRKLNEGVVPDQNAALARGLAGLRAKGWCTEERSKWVINRAATLLAWPPLEVPPSRTLVVASVDTASVLPAKSPAPFRRVLTDIEKILLR